MDDVPLIHEKDLDTAEEGLYLVVDAREHPITKDITDGFDVVLMRPFAGRGFLYARVRAGGEIPKGVESFTVRGDGKQVITQFVVDIDGRKVGY